MWLLQSQQHLAVFPQFFDLIKIALVGGKEVDDDIAVIHDDPAVAGIPLFFRLLFEHFADIIDGGIGERIQHAVACTGADDEIVGKRGNAFKVEQDNIFPFFIFERVDDLTGNIKRIQGSPH